MKVLPALDLKRDLTLLAQGKHIRGQYRGHAVYLRPTSLYKPHSPSLQIIELVIEAAEQAPLASLKPISSEKILLEHLAQVLSPDNLAQLKGQIYIAANGHRIIYTQSGQKTGPVDWSAMLDILVEVTELYPHMVDLGGEIVPTLVAASRHQAHPLRLFIPPLLRDIQVDTTTRLGGNPRSFLCQRCLVYCAAHKMPLSKLAHARFYGCRNCGQSREVVKWKQKIVAVLDSHMAQAYLLKEGVLRGNWLIMRSLFDFDEVHVVAAADEAIERFSVQVGNDMDEVRRSKYPHMVCLISPEAGLSPHSINILENTFGRVTVVR